MVRSMTGYGRGEYRNDEMIVSVELKSVNHRYFEFTSKVPRNYGFLDEKLKSYVQSSVSRGKIECNVYIENLENDDVVITVNHTLASGYLEALKELETTYGLRNDVSVTGLSRYADIFSVHKQPADEEKIWEAVRNALDVALKSFVDMRKTEGEKLRKDIESRLNTILEKVEFIEKRSPQTVIEYNEKLKTRIKDLLADASVDENRILNEAAIYADKIAVDEETVRLRSHISQLLKMFDEDDAVGRKMDFLVQEINREANTIGSKAQDTEIASCVLSVKAEVEKIREQVQNIE